MAEQRKRYVEDGWLRRDDESDLDDAGSVVLAWRTAAGWTQTELAKTVGTTQQHLSQIEQGQRPVPLELRRRLVTEVGIAAEDLGLLSSCARRLVSHDNASADSAASRLRWRQERRWLNEHRPELGRLAAQLYPPEHRVSDTTVIAPPEWLPRQPLELGSLALRLDEGPQTADVDGSEPETAATRPLRTTGLRFERYSSAVKHLNSPVLFESRPCYRLLSNFFLATSRMEFGLASYFDKIDTCEAIAHEMATACMTEGFDSSLASLRKHLSFRDLIVDPFDSQRRAIIPGIATLTIRLRRYPAEPSFLLHWRDPTKVATAGGTYGVIPTGEFQPSSVALWDRHNDFNLWRNIAREYSEELLGEPEHDGTRSQPIDYEKWSFFQQLQAAQARGSVSTHFLGLGLNALTLAACILTVVVIDDDVFTKLFGTMVRFNDEGEVVSVGGGTPIEGVPFTEQAVRRLLTTEPIAGSGSACLALAWKHRTALDL